MLKIPLFFDFEFTHLSRKTLPISLAIKTTINGKDMSFYAEWNNSGEWKILPFVKEHVIPKLLYNNMHKVLENNNINNIIIKGDNSDIKAELAQWLRTIVAVTMAEEEVQLFFVGDVLGFDWLLLSEVLNINTTKRNENPTIPSYVSYIPIDIASLLFDRGIDPDINRYAWLGIENSFDVHNAMEDAKIIEKVYKKIARLNNNGYFTKIEDDAEYILKPKKNETKG